MFEVRELAPWAFPQETGLRRDPALKSEAQPSDFEDKYDWATLAYGAAQGPRGLVLVCPKLLNFEEILRAGTISSAAGRHPVLRIRKHRRHDEVFLDGRAHGAELVFEHGDLRLTCPVWRGWERFTGHRCLVTTSKNNELAWIADWVAHHVRHQGAEAVLIHDNLSDLYTAQEILDALRPIDGLKAARVLSVPCRYGPLGKVRPRGVGKFLQSGLLNLARHGALSGARSVLQCDIDEVALSDPKAPTLFEAAERGWLGYATARAFWRSAPQGTGMPRHGDHVLSWRPERTSKEKWAVRPDGRLGGFAWDVHGVAAYRFNRFAMTRGVRFFHCERISTDWKRPRADADAKAGARPDAEAEAALTRAGLRPLGAVFPSDG